VSHAVKDTPELRRVLGIARRLAEDGATPELTALMTNALKSDGGTMTLRPLQALALRDIGVHRGAFCPMGVGDGKTIVSLMAAAVLEAKRPMLMLPAGLIENAERARRVDLAPHWLIPNHVRIFSYEMLGRAQSANELESYKPDALIFDEVHRLKNRDAACTRRVARYMAGHSSTAFVAMSGTIMRDSILDFAHILWWALKQGTPLPSTRHELEEWANALDEPKAGRPGQEYSRLEPGALLQFATREPVSSGTDLERARRGFRARLVETPGVVATAGDGERVDCSIYLKAQTYKVAPKTEDHFRTLRGDHSTPDTTFQYPGWQRPDGKEFETGVEVWACARQLALGFHYEWDPPPPKEWMTARRAWSKYVRGILSYSKTYDSPSVVVQAIDAGKIPDEGGVLAAWRKVKPSFKPRTVPVWHDDSVLEICAAWGKQPGIIWTEHGYFGRRLAQETGLPYFGRKGMNADGVYIEDSDSKTIIASIKANRDGRNLQHKWSRNLIVSPPDGADVWQQAIARTHRPLQKADEVIVDVLLGCREHVSAWRKAWAGTQAILDTVGGTPKLLLADVSFPSDAEIDSYRGPRW
jgi:hypothetical protein